MTIPSPKRILESWSAMLGIWGSTYLELLDALDIEFGIVSETSEWPLLIIGAAGTGSVLVSSWNEGRSERRRRR